MVFPPSFLHTSKAHTIRGRCDCMLSKSDDAVDTKRPGSFCRPAPQNRSMKQRAVYLPYCGRIKEGRAYFGETFRRNEHVAGDLCTSAPAHLARRRTASRSQSKRHSASTCQTIEDAPVRERPLSKTNFTPRQDFCATKRLGPPRHSLVKIYARRKNFFFPT